MQGDPRHGRYSVNDHRNPPARPEPDIGVPGRDRPRELREQRSRRVTAKRIARRRKTA